MIVLAIIVGLIAGLLGGFFGISSAFILITLISYLEMVPDHFTGAGVALLVMLPSAILLAVYHIRKNKKIDFKLVGVMMVFYIIGTILGASTSLKFTDKQLKLYVALLFFSLGIISMVIYMRVEDGPSDETDEMKFTSRLASIKHKA
jgi:uncharacterized membrane protein YfcA